MRMVQNIFKDWNIFADFFSVHDFPGEFPLHGLSEQVFGFRTLKFIPCVNIHKIPEQTCFSKWEEQENVMLFGKLGSGIIYPFIFQFKSEEPVNALKKSCI